MLRLLPIPRNRSLVKSMCVLLKLKSVRSSSITKPLRSTSERLLIETSIVSPRMAKLLASTLKFVKFKSWKLIPNSFFSGCRLWNLKWEFDSDTLRTAIVNDVESLGWSVSFLNEFSSSIIFRVPVESEARLTYASSRLIRFSRIILAELLNRISDAEMLPAERRVSFRRSAIKTLRRIILLKGLKSTFSTVTFVFNCSWRMVIAWPTSQVCIKLFWIDSQTIVGRERITTIVMSSIFPVFLITLPP